MLDSTEVDLALLRLLDERGPLKEVELEALSGLHISVVRVRLSVYYDHQLAITLGWDSQKRTTGDNTWLITPFGIEYLKERS